MAIEIVDLPIQNGDFPSLCKRLPEGKHNNKASTIHQPWLGIILHPRKLGVYPTYMAMDQYLLIPFLGGWTSIYQLFWCSPGVQGFDTLPYSSSIFGPLWCTWKIFVASMSYFCNLWWF